MKTCSLLGCERRMVAKGLCRSHYYGKRNKEKRAAIRALHRPCHVCGTDLVGRPPNARFCSVNCKSKAWSDRRYAADRARLDARVCVECGARFGRERSGKAVTCSKACGVRYQNRRKDEKREVAWRSKKQPCPRCGAEIPPDRRRGTRFCSVACKRLEMSRRWRERAPGYMRLHFYGVTPEQYAALVEKQGGRCAICKAEPNGKSLHVDHDHATGSIRGLLCNSCNNGLGRFFDDPARLRAALEYLAR